MTLCLITTISPLVLIEAILNSVLCHFSDFLIQDFLLFSDLSKEGKKHLPYVMEIFIFQSPRVNYKLHIVMTLVSHSCGLNKENKENLYFVSF